MEFVLDWILRFFKGALIGTGFILPGISGGALAVVFGFYQRIVSFIAHVNKDFVKNVFFFIPVVSGGLVGIFLLSHPLSYLLNNFSAYLIWGFIGCIIGVFPSLWRESGKQGRDKVHYIIFFITCVIGFYLLYVADSLVVQSLELNFFTWMFAGSVIAIGGIIPGLSSSNLLIYLGFYEPMISGLKTLDFGVLLPIFFGFIICLIPVAKAIEMLFKKVYAGMYHFIIGIVVASTLMIIPTDFNYLSGGVFICLIAMLSGVVLGWWMRRLEEKYSR